MGVINTPLNLFPHDDLFDHYKRIYIYINSILFCWWECWNGIDLPRERLLSLSVLYSFASRDEPRSLEPGNILSIVQRILHRGLVVCRISGLFRAARMQRMTTGFFQDPSGVRALLLSGRLRLYRTTKHKRRGLPIISSSRPLPRCNSLRRSLGNAEAPFLFDSRCMSTVAGYRRTRLKPPPRLTKRHPLK
jgi:hypothetical protein